MSRADRARVRGTATWSLTGALAVLILTACTSLAPVLRGAGWWFALAVTTVTVLFAAASLRRVGFRFPPLGASAVLLGLVTLVFGAGTGFVAVIPTADTLDRFTVLVRTGFRSIQQQSPPAVAEEGIVFLLVCAVGAVAVIMEFLAIGRRLPAVAASPLLVVLVLPGLIVQGGAGVLSLVLTACAFLVLLAVDVRVRRAQAADAPARVSTAAPARGVAVVVGGFGVVTALLLSSAMAGLAQGSPGGTGPSGLLFGSGVRTMIDLGADLRRPDAVPALHYSTDASTPPYLKLLTLDTFTGATWTASETKPDPQNTPEFMPRPPGLSDAVATTTTKTAIVVDGVRTTWLPAPSPATRVQGLRGEWTWNSDTGAIGSTASTTTGQDYSVTALQLNPTALQLRESNGSYPQEVQRYLDLPGQYPAVIHETAVSVTGGSGSDFDSAVALQDYLRGSAFTYDTEAPVGNDGAGADVIAAFLKAKRGYCVHFASAMAVMARTLGIPSRVAVGYLPGTREANYGEGSRRFNVTSHDLHSWPELYFTGIGWVPFEPTPGRGSVPDYATPESSTVGVDPSTGLPSSAPRPSKTATANDIASPTGATATTDSGTRLADLGPVLVLVLAVVLAPGAVRAARRSRRRRALGAGIAGPDTAWREVSDTALDYGIHFSDTQTPREQAARLDSALAGPAVGRAEAEARQEALRRLRRAQELASYARSDAGGDGPELTADLGAVTAGIAAQATPQARWRARLAPASLWPAALSGKREERPRRL